MASRIISILLLLSIKASPSDSAANTSCVVDLPSFIAAFRSNITSTSNILKIRQTFYPQDKPAPHVVVVHYCYEELRNNNNDTDTNNDTAIYSYVWTDNPIFFVVDYYLFTALTFELAGLGDIGEQFFVIPQSCNDTNTEELLLAVTIQVTLLILFYIYFLYIYKVKVNWRN